MAHPQATRNAVRSSFVFDCLSLESAAERHNVGYQTARKWKTRALEKGDNWDKARDAATLASGDLGKESQSIIQQFVRMFNATFDELESKEGEPQVTAIQRVNAMAKLSDAYAKFTKAAGGSDQKIATMAVALKVLEEQSKFVREHYSDDPEKMAFFIEMLEPFGQQLNEVFG